LPSTDKKSLAGNLYSSTPNPKNYTIAPAANLLSTCFVHLTVMSTATELLNQGHLDEAKN